MLSIRLASIGQTTSEYTSVLQDAITQILTASRIAPFPDGVWKISQTAFNALVSTIVIRANEMLPKTGVAKYQIEHAAAALSQRGYQAGSIPRPAPPPEEPRPVLAPTITTTVIPIPAPIPAPIRTSRLPTYLTADGSTPPPTYAPAREPGSAQLPIYDGVVPPSPAFPALPVPHVPIQGGGGNAWLWIGGIAALLFLSGTETPRRSRRKKSAGNFSSRGGLSGETANCLLWQEVIEERTGALVWRCLQYASSCDAKPGKPGSFKFQKRTCVKSKRVKSRSGKFKSATLERCDKYARVEPKTNCLPEPFAKGDPSPGHGVNIKQITKGIAKQMAEERNDTEEIAGKAFGREIIDRGGIRPYKGRSRSGKRVKGGEEYAVLPLFMRRKDGLPLDEMAAEMGFEDDRALLEAIRSEYGREKGKKKRIWSAKDFMHDAEDQVWTAIDAAAVSGLGQDLFPGLKRELTLKTEDAATSDDPLEIFLQRKGWDTKRVNELQANIAEKAVPDMFTSKKTPLDASEKELQRHIQEFFDLSKPAKKAKKKKSKKKAA